MPKVPVIAQEPSIRDITRYIEVIGTLEPSLDIEIRPEVDGKLTKVIVKEGEWVDAGAPLFEIDKMPYKIRVQEGEAQLAIDRAQLRAAEKKLARLKPLVQKDLVAQTEWDDVETDAEKALALVALDEARLSQARLDLEHCTVTAPVAGRIGKLDAHCGSLVARAHVEPLARIVQMNPLKVEFTLTEKEFEDLPDEVSQFEAIPLCSSKECGQGNLSFLDNRFDSSTGLIVARGRILNEDQSFRPGQIVQVRIPTAVISKALVIPQKAIRYNPEGPYVYVVQPDETVAIRQLILGEEDGIDQVVQEGIDPTEKLVIEGHLRLSPGAKVEVKP